jgi:quercetin dioxygenase-like cupin family protein
VQRLLDAHAPWLSDARDRSPEQCGKECLMGVPDGRSFSYVRLVIALMMIGGVAAALFDGAQTIGTSEHGHHQHAMHTAPHPSGTADARTQARPGTIVKPISCEKLPDVPGKVVATALVEFPPRAYTPAHRHPGSVQAFVLRGTLRSQIAGGAPVTYRAGETWFEPFGVVHLFAENPTDEPAELLATFITDEDCGPLVIPEPR